MPRSRKRYAHYYNGGRTSRGKRAISKMTKGLKCGDVYKILTELKGDLNARPKDAAGNRP